ncbi:MAG: hypothetical protein ACK4PR_08305, partial [Gammaproteobacteria bacterium]
MPLTRFQQNLINHIIANRYTNTTSKFSYFSNYLSDSEDKEHKCDLEKEYFLYEFFDWQLRTILVESTPADNLDNDKLKKL